MPKIVKKKAIKKAVKKAGPSRGIAYFSKRSLERAVLKGTKEESHIAIHVVGYTVKESEGWVVKEFVDGTTEKISEIEKSQIDRFVLD